VTVDGRSAKSVGLRTKEVAEMMRKLGADDALNLDGGGSSTLVAREPGEQDVTVQNVPSDGSQRLVDNGIGIFSSGG
jgi:exopolysaccharide biosynthesis protein